MTLEDFLARIRDRSVSRDRLARDFKELFYQSRASHTYDHLDSDNQDLVWQIIIKHRDRFLAGEKASGTDIDREYYNIYEHRHELGLLENDLADIKEILNSFKS